MSYLKPKTKSHEKIRSQKNGQFINPPAYMDALGGFTSAGKLRRTGLASLLNLEKGGPQAKRGKPI